MAMIPALLLLAAAAEPVCIDHVHDGDTFTLCSREKIRIANIDAPELPGSPKCKPVRPGAWCNFDKGYQSRDALAGMLAAGSVSIIRQGQDRYGRTLARVMVNGKDAGAVLVSVGLAKPWR